MTHNGESITMNDYPDYVVCLVCKKVGEHMKADEARLLPTLRTELANKQLDNAILSLSLTCLNKTQMQMQCMCVDLISMHELLKHADSP